ncbi:MAG: IS256 family transposase, partial [Acidimicrobiales bacterium]|nr:IS256 family transposase [Acidimicrobiales bacterium]
MTHHDDARLDDLLAHLGEGDTKDLFRALLQRGMQELIDAELTATIGAELHERTDTRTNQRNGGRSRTLSTPAGDIELRIPKLRVGSFFPSLLEPRRRVDQALWAVIMTAYITGTSTRKIDDLVRALGCESGISKSTVSRICKGIDDEVAVFRTRPLGHLAMPYLFLDATYIKARNQHRIVGRAVVVATAVTIDGNREVLGVDVGDSEDEVFWTAFLRTLRDRGLSGVRLVISDAHSGLKASIARVFAGATWQRCKVHLARNILATVNHAHKDMVAAMVRTIHAQPDAAATRAQLHAVVEMLTDRFPNSAEILA